MAHPSSLITGKSGNHGMIFRMLKMWYGFGQKKNGVFLQYSTTNYNHPAVDYPQLPLNNVFRQIVSNCAIFSATDFFYKLAIKGRIPQLVRSWMCCRTFHDVCLKIRYPGIPCTGQPSFSQWNCHNLEYTFLIRLSNWLINVTIKHHHLPKPNIIW